MTGLQNSQNPNSSAPSKLAKPLTGSPLADYDWRRFARDVRRKVQESGKALRPLAPEIGVTFTDLSRACGGQMIGTGKVIALCDAFGFDLRAYYVAPENGDPATGLPVKGGAEICNQNKVLQLASRETGDGVVL